MHKFNNLTRISLDLFLDNSSLEEQGALINALDSTICTLLKDNLSVYLDNFGIIYPGFKNKVFSSTISGKYISREATVLAPYFEKCIELTSFHREAFSELVELNTVAEIIFPNLPVTIREKWNQNTIKKILKVLVQQIKAEVIISGSSNRLVKTGTIISLHNRQGNELKDWFAGADIFLKPAFNEIVKFEESKVAEKLSFTSAWEPFEAFYKELNRYTLNVKEQLLKLGFETEASHKNFEIKVFQNDNLLIFVSNGIRKLSLNPDFGTEFCVILEENNPDISCIDTIMTMGWLLASGHKQKILDFGKGLSLGVKLIEGSELEAVFTAPYKKIPGVRDCVDKNIEYVTLVGISASEYESANLNGSEYLSAILRYRGIDQITKFRNYSIISETNIN